MFISNCYTALVASSSTFIRHWLRQLIVLTKGPEGSSGQSPLKNVTTSVPPGDSYARLSLTQLYPSLLETAKSVPCPSWRQLSPSLLESVLESETGTSVLESETARSVPPRELHPSWRQLHPSLRVTGTVTDKVLTVKFVSNELSQLENSVHSRLHNQLKI